MKSKTMVLHHPVSAFRKISMLLACVGMAMIGGCGDDGNAEVTPPENFVFTAFNSTSYPITDVTIHGMALPVKFHKIESKSSDTISGKAMDIPKMLKVAWTDRKGDRSDYEVKLKGKIPERFDGSMNFTIPSNGRVQFEAGTAP